MNTPPDPEIPRAINPATGRSYVQAESAEEVEPTKSWWQSKIIVTVLVMLLSRVATAVFKTELTEADLAQITQVVQAIIDVVGTILVISSRVKGRSKPINGQIIPKTPTNLWLFAAFFAIVNLSSCAHVNKGMAYVGLTWDEVLVALKKAGLAAGKVFVVDFKDGVVDSVDLLEEETGAKTPVVVTPLP